MMGKLIFILAQDLIRSAKVFTQDKNGRFTGKDFTIGSQI